MREQLIIRSSSCIAGGTIIYHKRSLASKLQKCGPAVKVRVRVRVLVEGFPVRLGAWAVLLGPLLYHVPTPFRVLLIQIDWVIHYVIN